MSFSTHIYIIKKIFLKVNKKSLNEFDKVKNFRYNNNRIEKRRLTMNNSDKKNAAAPSQETSTEYEIIHLDYTLKTPEERAALVNKIIQHANPSQLTHKYLDILSDYRLDARSKAEKKDKTILTNNRLVTVNKRETSYEDLVSKFENGEDGVSNLAINDKAAILSPKIEITADDLEEVPGLKELKD